MHTIWKYPLPRPDTFILELPKGAKFLSARMQGENPQSWWLLDETLEKVPRKFVVLGTGHEVPEHEKLTFLTTFQVHGGAFIFHLFEYEAPVG